MYTICYFVTYRIYYTVTTHSTYYNVCPSFYLCLDIPNTLCQNMYYTSIMCNVWFFKFLVVPIIFYIHNPIK